MGDGVAERLDRIEAALASARTPLEQRVFELEGKVRKLEPKKKDFWEKLQALSGVVVALVTAAVGYWLTGSVNLALERRKLEAANVEKMRDVITRFNDAEITPAQAEALGLTLGAFGEFAVPSLVAALATPTVNRAAGARTGLLAASLGADDRKVVCETLAGVIASRSRRYSVLMYLRSVELLGLIECRGAADAALRDLLALTSAAGKPGSALAAALDDKPPVGPDEVAELRARLCATVQLRHEAACAEARK
jgi:hypothetical protein